MKIDQKYTKLMFDMLSIPSLSREEVERADFLEHWLRNDGYIVERIGNNLIVTGGNSPDKASILLNSHLDTVPPADGWQKDPFSPILESDRFIGLGSNDAGASVVTLIASYRNLITMGLADKVVLVISAEEEVSGMGGLISVLPSLPSLEFAVVGEPTGMQPAVAERGLMVIDAVAMGIAGHAARNEGENALYKAIEDIQNIRELVFNESSEWLNTPSVQVTMISSGTTHNVVPSKCEYVLDVRSNDIYSNSKLLEILKKTCTHSQLTARSIRLNSSSIDKNNFIFNVLDEMNLIPFGSPTLSDMALLDIPSIKIGPGHSSRSHTANEYIHLEEMGHAIDVYTELIGKIIKQMNDL
jgi:acetylornithine deacetylase